MVLVALMAAGVLLVMKANNLDEEGAWVPWEPWEDLKRWLRSLLKRGETEDEETEILELKWDAELGKKYVKKISRACGDKGEDALATVMALASVMVARAKWIKKWSAEEDKGKIEQIIVSALLRAPDLDFTPYLKEGVRESLEEEE